MQPQAHTDYAPSFVSFQSFYADYSLKLLEESDVVFEKKSDVIEA